MMEIVKIYKECLPAVRFIGKKYTDEDRVSGSFGEKWEEWLENRWFHKMLGDSLSVMPGDYGSYLGAMRVVDNDFEYWIGTVFHPDTRVPEGFEYVDIEELNVATFWIYGNKNSGELFGLEVHNKCLEELAKTGFVRKENDWCFERYTDQRFTAEDENGNVTLDYCISVEY